jgi:hypothetical protein
MRRDFQPTHPADVHAFDTVEEAVDERAPVDQDRNDQSLAVILEPRDAHRPPSGLPANRISLVFVGVRRFSSSSQCCTTMSVQTRQDLVTAATGSEALLPQSWSGIVANVTLLVRTSWLPLAAVPRSVLPNCTSCLVPRTCTCRTWPIGSTEEKRARGPRHGVQLRTAWYGRSLVP